MRAKVTQGPSRPGAAASRMRKFATRSRFSSPPTARPNWPAPITAQPSTGVPSGPVIGATQGAAG